MLLTSLKLENIRSYINEKIEFPEGSVLLNGDIGSGKSTILLAIEFALFGILRSELSGSSLLRHGTNKGHVELSFIIDNKNYTIKRTLKKSKDTVNQDSGYLVTDDKKFEGTPVELKAKILHILGYPESMLAGSKSLVYRFTVYTAQEQMKQILFEDKETRLNTLRKVFGVDKYKTIKDNSSILIRELKNEKNEMNARLEDYDDIKKRLTEKISFKDNLMQSIADSAEKLEQQKKEVFSQKKILAEFEEKVKSYLQIKKAIEIKELSYNSKKAELMDLEKSIDLKALNDLKKRLLEFSDVLGMMDENLLEMQLNDLTEKYNNSIKERSKSEENKKITQRRIDETLLQIKELSEKTSDYLKLKARIDDYKTKLEIKKSQEKLLEDMLKKDKETQIIIERLDVKIKQGEKLIHFMEKNDNCPTCMQGIDNNHKAHVEEIQGIEIKKYKEDKIKSSETLQKIGSNIKKLKKNLDILIEIETKFQKEKESIARMQSYLAELENKQKELSKLTEQKNQLSETQIFPEEELRSDIKKVKERLTAVRENNMRFREKKNIMQLIESESRNMLQKENQLKKTRKEIEKLVSDLEELSQSMQDLIEVNAQFLDQKNRFEESQNIEKELEIKFATLKQENKSIEEDIKDLEKKLVELESMKKRLEENSKMLDWVEGFFIKLMTTMEKHVMISIHREFNSLLKQWFSLLIEDVEINLDDEFSVRISQDGYETDLSDLSGGEKTSVALAYRLALNKVVNDLVPMINTKDLIILDEPTDGFSTEQLDKVRDILNELDMKQTIIVSHESKMESYVEKVIRIEKRDGVSCLVN